MQTKLQFKQVTVDLPLNRKVQITSRKITQSLFVLFHNNESVQIDYRWVF